jgi:hypothetical protein
MGGSSHVKRLVATAANGSTAQYQDWNEVVHIMPPNERDIAIRRNLERQESLDSTLWFGLFPLRIVHGKFDR